MSKNLTQRADGVARRRPGSDHEGEVGHGGAELVTGAAGGLADGGVGIAVTADADRNLQLRGHLVLRWVERCLQHGGP